MHGLIMERPLLITDIMRHARRNHPRVEIVSETVEGGRHRYTYADAFARVARLAHALDRLGAKSGDRVGTLAWNTFRHFELYFATAGGGTVCHTINPRLFPEQLVYIINHAEDRWLFLDSSFVELIEQLAPRLTTVEKFIILCDRDDMPDTSLPGALCYEDLLAAEDEDYAWPDFDERTASGLCYTSGTTGNPKGVLYSHRGIVLHAMAFGLPDSNDLSMRDAIMPVVPMFHVNAWGSPFAAPMHGARLVLPGPHMLDGETLRSLINDEGVTIAMGVPTIWMALMKFLRDNGGDLKPMNRVIIGGSACPAALMDAFRAYGVRVRHAWGMTEMSPLGIINTPRPEFAEWPREQQRAMDTKTGHGFFGVQMKIVDDEDNELPWDGESVGALKVRGPWVCRSYYRDDGTATAHDEKGWFNTGDVATIDEHGFVQITDRNKDMIKSGGEWISSIELENIAVGCDGVAEAAAVAIEHAKWGERPLLVVRREPGATLDEAAVLDFYEDKVAKWWIPDAVAFVEEIPHTATGKISKLTLREQFKGYRWRSDEE
jgi:3-(methylthio)propionyl---CoA ligase